MYGTALAIREANRYLEMRASRGKIDDPKNLRRTPVVLFNGRGDEMVYKKVMVETHKQLSEYIDADKLSTNFNTAAGHVWSIDSGRCRCGQCPYGGLENLECCHVNNCGYDLSGAFMRATYGSRVKPRVAASSQLYWINQWDYWRGGAPQNSTVMEWMMAYVPRRCQASPGQCKLHINYHGCVSPGWRPRIMWAQEINLNEYAEANDMIVLYPQAQGSDNSGEGCWNWEAYVDDADFDTRDGKQLGMVMRIAANLTNALKDALVSTGGTPPKAVQETHEENDYFYGSYSYGYSYGWEGNAAARQPHKHYRAKNYTAVPELVEKPLAAAGDERL